MRTSLFIGLWLGMMVLATALPRTGSAQCLGDCDGDGAVSVDELVRGVNIALGVAAVSSCTALDGDASGTVTIDEVITAVNRALTGCNLVPTTSPTTSPTPTATATATSGSAATPTPIVPGCDRGVVSASVTDVVDSNVATAPVDLSLVAAAEVRDPRSGRYIWSITGNTCAVTTGLARSIQIQIIGAPTGFAPGSYPITPPLGSLVYLETPAIGVPQPRIWQTTGATLVIDSVAGDSVQFHFDDAPMVPNLIVAGDPPPRGTFRLSAEGTIAGFTSD